MLEPVAGPHFIRVERRAAAEEIELILRRHVVAALSVPALYFCLAKLLSKVHYLCGQ